MKKKTLLAIGVIFCLSAMQSNCEAKMSAQSNKLYNSATIQEQEGNFAQALEYIKKALQYSPDDAILNIKLAGLYQHLGNYEEAIVAYNKAISLRPHDGFLYISLANLFMQKYDYKNALFMYEQAQTLMQDYKYNYINIANAKSLLGDNKGAIESYKQFLTSYPNDIEGHSAIANLYLEEKDYTLSI